jgi:hypothetical protein
MFVFLFTFQEETKTESKGQCPMGFDKKVEEKEKIDKAGIFLVAFCSNFLSLIRLVTAGKCPMGFDKIGKELSSM